MGSRKVEYEAYNPIPGQYQGFANQLGSLAGNAPGTSPVKQQGLDLLSAWGSGPNQLETAGSGYLSDVLGGKYLDPASNPYLDKTYSTASKKVMDDWDRMNDQTDTALALNGLGYSSIRADQRGELRKQTGDKLNELATSIYGGAYNNERNRMDGALQPALSYAAMPGQKAQALIAGGDSANNDYYKKLSALQSFLSLVRSEPQQVQYSNPLGDILTPLAQIGGQFAGTEAGATAITDLLALIGL